MVSPASDGTGAIRIYLTPNSLLSRALGKFANRTATPEDYAKLNAAVEGDATPTFRLRKSSTDSGLILEMTGADIAAHGGFASLQKLHDGLRNYTASETRAPASRENEVPPETRPGVIAVNNAFGKDATVNVYSGLRGTIRIVPDEGGPLSEALRKFIPDASGRVTATQADRDALAKAIGGDPNNPPVSVIRGETGNPVLETTQLKITQLGPAGTQKLHDDLTAYARQKPAPPQRRSDIVHDPLDPASSGPLPSPLAGLRPTSTGREGIA